MKKIYFIILIAIMVGGCTKVEKELTKEEKYNQEAKIAIEKEYKKVNVDYKLAVEKYDANYLAMKKAYPYLGEELEFEYGNLTLTEVKEIHGVALKVDKNKDLTVYYQEYRRRSSQYPEKVSFVEQNWIQIEKDAISFMKQEYGESDFKLVGVETTYGGPDNRLVAMVQSLGDKPYLQVLNVYIEADGIYFTEHPNYNRDLSVALQYFQYTYQDELDRIDKSFFNSDYFFSANTQYSNKPNLISRSTIINMSPQLAEAIARYVREHPGCTKEELKRVFEEEDIEFSMAIRFASKDGKYKSNDDYLELINEFKKLNIQIKADWSISLYPGKVINKKGFGYRNKKVVITPIELKEIEEFEIKTTWEIE